MATTDNFDGAEGLSHGIGHRDYQRIQSSDYSPFCDKTVTMTRGQRRGEVFTIVDARREAMGGAGKHPEAPPVISGPKA